MSIELNNLLFLNVTHSQTELSGKTLSNEYYIFSKGSTFETYIVSSFCIIENIIV